MNSLVRRWNGGRRRGASLKQSGNTARYVFRRVGAAGGGFAETVVCHDPKRAAVDTDG
ncbi:hypothetical protein [Lysobacter gummosus]|uniref:hypothetical protein n=1 Tax=Lysobacter gummosus TaxID=262324 RepID=UPI003636D708